MDSLTCVELGEGNGGIVTNISQTGLALTAAMGLPAESLTRLRIQLPRSRESLDVYGQLRWRSESRRKAGFQFVDLTEQDRRRIEEWIFGESSPQATHSGKTAILEPPRRPPRELRPLSLKGLTPAISAPGQAGEIPKKNLPPFAPPVRPQRPTQEAMPQLHGAQMDLESGSPEESEQPISIPDQRLQERQRVKALSFIELGESNGGVILDISGGGVAVRTAVAVADEYFPRIRFQLPPQKQWIQASGRVVQLDESKTRVCIQFVDLSPEASTKISEWIASQASAVESPSRSTAVYEKTAQLLESLAAREAQKPVLPSIPRTVLQARAESVTPEKTPPSPPVAPPPAPNEAPVLVSSPVPIIAPPAPLAVQKVAKKASLELSKTTAKGRMNPAAARPSWVTLTISVGLAALLSFVGAWIVAERAARDQVLRMIGTVPAAKTEPAKPVMPAMPPGIEQPAPPVENAAASVVPAETQPPVTKSAPLAVEKPVAPSRPISLAAVLPSKQAATLSANSPISSPPRPTSETKSSPSREVKPAVPATISAAVVPPPEPQRTPTPTQKAEPQPAPVREASAAASAPISTQQGNPSPVVAATPQTPGPLARPVENAEVTKGAVSVSFSPFPSIRIPPELKSQASKLGTSLQIGQVVSRVDPVYPEDAERQRIEGTVKLHVIIGREGDVQDVTVINGPAAFALAATNALRQWRYKQTLFGGQPIEAEEDVTVVFRMMKLHP